MNTPKGTMIADWAYIFDTLSILEVKDEKLGGQYRQLCEFIDHIVGQLGFDRYWDIRESKEYQALFAANMVFFDGVEKVRHGDGMEVKEFDELNQARHRAKQALQRRFWGGELTEVKT